MLGSTRPHLPPPPSSTHGNGYVPGPGPGPGLYAGSGPYGAPPSSHTNGLRPVSTVTPSGSSSTTTPATASLNGTDNTEPDIGSTDHAALKNRRESIVQLFAKLNPALNEESDLLLKNVVNLFEDLSKRIEKIESVRPLLEPGKEPPLPPTEDQPAQEIEQTTKFFCVSIPSELRQWDNPSKHVIEVLYKRSDDWVAENNSTAVPDPGNVVVLEVRIESKPIATFLNKMTETTLTKDGHLVFSEPFRLLIRQEQSIQEHIRKLVKQIDALPEASENSENGTTVRKSQSHGSTLASDDKTSPANPDEVVDGRKAEDADSPVEDNVQALDHFMQLHHIIESYFSEQLTTLKNLKGLTQTQISFEQLWMLFESGTDIYCRARKGGHKFIDSPDMPTERLWTPQSFRIVSTMGGGRLQTFLHRRLEKAFAAETVSTSTRDCFADFSLQCYYIEYTGSGWQPVLDHIVLKPFDGLMDITDLEAYPIHYRSQLKESVDPHQDLLERGQKYVNLTQISHLRYEGPTVGDSSEEIASPVIIDMKTGYQARNQEKFPLSFRPTRFDLSMELERSESCEVTGNGHGCALGCCTGVGKDQYMAHQKTVLNKSLDRLLKDLEELDNSTRRIQVNPQQYLKGLTEKNLLHLLPGVVVGYPLRNRKWVMMNLDLLEEMKYNALDGGWDDLVLPDGHKEMVRAMVEKFADKDKASPRGKFEKFEADLVRGKGKGCIILLHGVPGVGKTSTAECVAAYTKRPLLPITCGDIGYTPAEVETFLDYIFTLAHKWGCVLLLDEADVFLAKRQKQDVKHNGLVSVFLRVLEYYSGILFLTTNRVGAIDDAFRSRIHLTLFYPQLDRNQTIKVWKSNIRRIKEYNKYRAKLGLPVMKYDRKELVAFAERRFEKSLQWNGRQIRNAFQTAIALAEYQANEKADKGDEQNASPYLGLEQFRTIAKATKIFDRYLFEMYGANEDTRAAHQGIRTNPKKLSMKATIDSDETGADVSQTSSEESDDDSDGHSGPKSSPMAKKKKSAKNSESKKVSTPKKRSSSDAKKEKSKTKDKKHHEGSKKGKPKQEVDSDGQESSENSSQEASSDEGEN